MDQSVVDFETKAIRQRPDYPPKPTGVSIKMPGKKPRYYAFGHPTGNNCSVNEARQALAEAYDVKAGTVFHGGSFDIDVGECWFGLRPRKHHDTLYLSFLLHPHEPTIALKPLGEKYLGMPPEERDVVRDWIFDNIRPNGRKMPAKFKKWGEYIGEAPGDLVGEYANGDSDRTAKLFEKFMPEVVERGMLSAYEREIKLTPITLEMERSGIRVDVPKIKRFLRSFEKFDEELLRRIRKKLRVGKDINLNSSAQLADAMAAADKFDHVIKTPTGKISTKIENLRKSCNDQELLDLLSVHSVVDKYVSSFLRPWLAQAEITGGRVLPRFSQVRSRSDDGGGGTRTGRYSSSDPNLQNISANVTESKNRKTLELMAKMLKEWYGMEFIGLRDVFLADDGTVMICIDYSQQEIRLLAHFAGGQIQKDYRKNPNMDVHDYIRLKIEVMTGKAYERKSVKIIVFGILYGMGVDKLAASLEMSRKEATELRNYVYAAVPGIRDLQDSIRRAVDRDEPIVTWGGREYFCEDDVYLKNGKRVDIAEFEALKKQMGIKGFKKRPGKMGNLEVISFGYKLLNYLIQGSAADWTKQGMIQVHERVPEARIAIQVHDELVCMAPSRKYGPRIAEAMCDMELSVKMLTETKYSETSWARAT